MTKYYQVTGCSMCSFFHISTLNESYFCYYPADNTPDIEETDISKIPDGCPLLLSDVLISIKEIPK